MDLVVIGACLISMVLVALERDERINFRVQLVLLCDISKLVQRDGLTFAPENPKGAPLIIFQSQLILT